MSFYKIEGGAALQGSIDVHGAKNAALPILAATILNNGISVIHNCPDLSDIESIITILRSLGCRVTRDGGLVTVDSSGFTSADIPLEFMKQTRSSTIFAGALLARTKRAFIAGSGGCCIGKRPIDLHLMGFKALGADVSFRPDGILCRAPHICPCKIHLDFPSVGATENLMLASSLTPGLTVISNAAKEPEISNLADYLRSIGVGIKGDGTSEIYIKGTCSPSDGEVTVIADRIVAATYAACVACAGGRVDVRGASPSLLSPVVATLRRMGMTIECRNDGFVAHKSSRCINLPYLCTGPYPALPTDCQPLIVAAMTTSYGFGALSEKIFENRMAHCKRLCDMGADISVSGRTAMVRGAERLHGAAVDASDLRCGAALVAAALGAEGTSFVSGVHYIDRGYENLCTALKSVGANIERIE